MSDVETGGRVDQSSNVEVGCLTQRARGPVVKNVLVHEIETPGGLYEENGISQLQNCQ